MRDGQGAPVESVLTQPKRAALFAYLAATQAQGFRRRDALLALFWPELSERRARDALNSAIYFLRRAVGDGVIVGRGAEEVGLAPGFVTCDLVEFDAALAAPDLPRALALVRGELLEGLVVADAPEFDDWLSRQRERVRSAARDAAMALAGSAADRGDAVRWARRATEVSPGDEGAVRLLLTALERSGDAAGALHQYEQFAASLRRTLDLDPSPQTSDLAAAIRERNRTSPRSVDLSPVPALANLPATLPAGTRGDLAPVPVVPLLSSATRRTARLRASWGLRTAALAVLVLSTALVARTVARRSVAPRSGATRASLAVFPFAYRGTGTQPFLGEGVARLLATSLDGIGELRVVDPRALLGAARLRDGADSGANALAWQPIASSLQAPWYVAGEIDAVGDSLDVRATLHESSGSGRVLARAQVRAGTDELFTVVDQLALQLVAAIPATAGARIDSVAARTTRSLPALRLYLAGEGEFRRGRFAEAIEAFRGAVAADSTFALAIYRLSNALTWSRTVVDTRPEPLADVAVRHAAHLPERERLLFRAWRSYLLGDAVDAEQRYREVLSTRPDDVEAHFYLGEVLFHWGPIFGRPSLEARADFEQVLRFEPDNAGALSHLVRLAASAGDTAQVHEYAGRLARLDPDAAEVFEVRTLEAFATRDTAGTRAFEHALAGQSSRDARRVVWTIVGHTRDDAANARLLTGLQAPTFDPFSRRLATLAGVLHQVALGRPVAAMGALAPNDVITAGRRAEYRAAIATLPFVSLPAESLRTVDAELRAFPARDSTIGPGQYSLPRANVYAPRRLYLLGLLALRVGDTASASHLADSLQAIVWGDHRDRLFSRSFGLLLRAELLASARRPADAWATLGLPGVEEDSNLTEVTSFPKAHERYLRGELLRALGRPQEAARWYATFPDLQLSDLPYRAMADLRVAQLAEARGDRGAALAGYRRATTAWQGAEPLQRALLDTARAGIRRLGERPPA